MPLYEYYDTRTGRKIGFYKSVEDRDKVPPYYKRITVPDKVHVAFGVESEQKMEISGRKGLADMEARLGTTEMERQMGYSRKQIKEAWAL